ncbi:MAG: ABC transporter substrate-binding protein, partial [Acidimicrobiales bacterium]
MLPSPKPCNRHAYVKTLLGDGQAQPTGTLIPQGIPGYDPQLQGAQRFNPTKARADLAASGVSPSQLQNLHILTDSYFVSQTEYLVNQIKTVLGINLVIDSVGDFPTLLQKVAAGNFDIYDLDYNNGLYPDPQTFMDLFL